MRKAAYVLIATCGLLCGAGWVASAPHLAVAADDPFFQQSGDAARGEHVFDAAGCAACHASPTPSGDQDRTKLGGGEALATPFGTFYVPNISSDPRDGIGSWSQTDIANALLSGVGRDGRHLYPAFPYTTYAHMRRTDVRDLIAYLRNLPAVQGVAPPHDLRFPYSIRRALGFWKLLFFRAGPIVDNPARDAAWNRGRYLVEAEAHCAECHSSRDILGGVVASQRFSGGPDPSGKGWVPNITPGSDGIADWTVSDIEGVLTDGVTPDDDDVGSTMVDVVHNISRLPKADISAIAQFIKALPPRTGPPKPKKTEQ